MLVEPEAEEAAEETELVFEAEEAEPEVAAEPQEVSLDANAAAVAINETNFPEAAFRELVEEFDINGNDSLSASEIAKVRDIYLFSSNVASLKGIEFFTSLTTLSCWDCKKLKSVNVSKNTKLFELECTGCKKLTSLDVSRNTKLQTLYIDGTGISNIDISKCKTLVKYVTDSVTSGEYEYDIESKFLCFIPFGDSEDSRGISKEIDLGLSCNANTNVNTGKGIYRGRIVTGNKTFSIKKTHRLLINLAASGDTIDCKKCVNSKSSIAASKLIKSINDVGNDYVLVTPKKAGTTVLTLTGTNGKKYKVTIKVTA